MSQPADMAEAWARHGELGAAKLRRLGRFEEAAAAEWSAQALRELGRDLGGRRPVDPVAEWERAAYLASVTGQASWLRAQTIAATGHEQAARSHRAISHAMACFSHACDATAGREVTGKARAG